MGVLVTVNVRDVDAGPLQGLNLGLGLAGEILRADGVAHRCLGEIQRLRTEGFVVGAEQRGDVPRVRDRDTVDEDEMAADPERGRVERQIDGVAEGGAGRHQAGRAEHARTVQLHDGTVDAGRETKIIGIEDEAGHGREAVGTWGLAAGSAHWLAQPATILSHRRHSE